MKYGVIVIGAGNGGLAAAATCAKAGVRTLLLERHNIPGGSASSFRRGRFEFEPSLHELTGTGNPDDPSIVEQFFARIGAQVDFVNEKSTFRLIVPARDDDPDSFISEDGVRVKVDARMPSGVEAFSRKLD
ncbi:MAG: NAD(P)-binding protein, partial [Clostridia bacterium]|nr:NAD(P)-binding protein [Clostridia bacterium]